MSGIPFLWLTGPPGVGKSSVAFAVFAGLARDGMEIGYADLDQLGLCYPAPPDDPGNDAVKSRNLGVLWRAFRAAGARCLVVSGGVEDAGLVRRHTDLLPDAELTLCRLRAPVEVLHERLRSRSWDDGLAADARRIAAELDRTGFGDVSVETAGRGVTELALLVREQTGWPRPGRQPPVPDTLEAAPEAGGAPVLWICGPSGVGTSTVAWQVSARLFGAGLKTGYLDLAQIGFCRPAPPVAGLVAGMWRTFLQAGAGRLVICGGAPDPATLGRYATLLPGTSLTVVRLRAGRDTLAERIRLRGAGGATQLPGDELRGAAPDRLRQAADRAAEQARGLDQAGIGDWVVDTDGRSADQVADLVRERVPAFA